MLLLAFLSYSQDSITGLLLAGIGQVGPQQNKNFVIVDASTYLFPLCAYQSSNYSIETQVSTIESAFADFTTRKDIAILLINQHVSRIMKRTILKR